MRTVAVTQEAELPSALASLGLGAPRPVVVLVGGAAGLDAAAERRLAPVVEAVGRAAAAHGAVVVDGATDSGVARLAGRARRGTSPFALLGVAVRALVADPAAPPGGERVPIEPAHDRVLLVPGSRWGDEVEWLQRAASAVAAGEPSVTVLVNGGEISLADAAASLAAGRRVVVVAGSGRAADAVAATRAGAAGDSRLRRLAGSGLVSIAAVGEDGVASLRRELEAALERS
jgi:hypothetical protein